MRKWTKATGLVFLAAASVYSGQVIGAAPAKPGKAAAGAGEAKNTDVKLLEDAFDPAGAAPTTKPADSAGAGSLSSSSGAPTTAPAASGSFASSGSGSENVANVSNSGFGGNASSSAGGAAASPAMLTNPDGTFSLNITNGADLVETLRVIGFQAQKSVLPSKDVRAALPALDLYNVTVREALDAILKVNGYVYKEEGNFIYVYSAKEAAEMEKAQRVTNTEVFRVYYTPAANAANMIKPVLSEAGAVALTTPALSGLDSGTKGTGGNDHSTEDVLVVTDYAENLDRVRRILREIDRRPQQILIEATIMRASLSDDNALGVDFNILSGVDFASLTSQNGQIINANLPSGEAAVSGANRKSSVGTGNNFTQSVAGGLKVGFLSSNVSVFVAALEGITDTTVLANPKVLALNKQKGEVIVGRKDGYLTTTVTESSTVQTVDFLDTGTRLIFRPFIGDDGYIRMEIHPEDSSGGLTAANLPFKITTEVTSNIMVKDGHTIVIGGLFRESSESNKSQIPVLGNIPLAGHLFKNQRDRSTREEIIILLTPHIVKDDVAYSEASEEMLKAGDQMRVGVRKGMMFWGRERLAETCYEQAVAEMNKSNPDRNKALWHLDCATNLNPKFHEAIQMKQDLTGRSVASVDNSAIRGFVRRQVLADRARVVPATLPSSDADAAMEPATQPATQPAQPSYADSDDAAAMVPATEPDDMAMVEESPVMIPVDSSSSSSEVATNSDAADNSFDSGEFTLVPATQPSTQPSWDSASNWGQAATSPFRFSMMFAGMREMFTLGNGSASQPAQSAEQSVTELPVEDLTGGSSQSQQSSGVSGNK